MSIVSVIPSSLFVSTIGPILGEDHMVGRLDRTANETCKPDADIARPASTVRILAIATREDLTIMRETRQVVGLSTATQRGENP